MHRTWGVDRLKNASADTWWSNEWAAWATMAPLMGSALRTCAALLQATATLLPCTAASPARAGADQDALGCAEGDEMAADAATVRAPAGVTCGAKERVTAVTLEVSRHSGCLLTDSSVKLLRCPAFAANS